MEYCYIFNYGAGEIYECTIPKNTENVLDYLLKEYGLNNNDILYMITQTKQQIQTLEPYREDE